MTTGDEAQARAQFVSQRLLSPECGSGMYTTQHASTTFDLQERSPPMNQPSPWTGSTAATLPSTGKQNRRPHAEALVRRMQLKADAPQVAYAATVAANAGPLPAVASTSAVVSSGAGALPPSEHPPAPLRTPSERQNEPRRETVEHKSMADPTSDSDDKDRFAAEWPESELSVSVGELQRTMAIERDRMREERITQKLRQQIAERRQRLEAPHSRPAAGVADSALQERLAAVARGEGLGGRSASWSPGLRNHSRSVAPATPLVRRLGGSSAMAVAAARWRPDSGQRPPQPAAVPGGAAAGSRCLSDSARPCSPFARTGGGRRQSSVDRDGWRR